MKRNCPKIRENYSLYKHLLGKEKLINKNEIFLEQTSNNKWRRKTEFIRHDSEEEILFEVAKQKIDFKYGLKIFIKELHPQPVFYFDSDGPTHDNRDGITKLSSTKVKTPHINYFDEKGENKAKRTQYIEDNEDALQNDINLGMSFFCKEANINSSGNIPTISYELDLLPLQQKVELDVHKGINFLDEN
jgi:hypothetical protein